MTRSSHAHKFMLRLHAGSGTSRRWGSRKWLHIPIRCDFHPNPAVPPYSVQFICACSTRVPCHYPHAMHMSCGCPVPCITMHFHEKHSASYNTHAEHTPCTPSHARLVDRMSAVPASEPQCSAPTCCIYTDKPLLCRLISMVECKELRGAGRCGRSPAH